MHVRHGRKERQSNYEYEIPSESIQFFEHRHSAKHVPTVTRRTHRCWVSLDGRPIELIVSDLPPLNRFPRDTLDEWQTVRCGVLSTADIYVLIFDVSDVRRTFNKVRELYAQLMELRRRDEREYGVLVVGNKTDLLVKHAEGEGPQELRDAVTLIRKNWKIAYVETSARYNYHIAQLFRLIAGGPGPLQRGGSAGADGRQGGTLRRDRDGKCIIL
ncbi:ras-like protein family member 10B [Ctenocephalides felis]|uniref:ras-like protein family member 10B n=1 Tax=Ctenocephalides felis TaxID=7515 RepID=UPI000E6E5289|nr:ras-like protein family member 10B [Ctenocephalides felis]